jgi:hypothetical protein
MMLTCKRKDKRKRHAQAVRCKLQHCATICFDTNTIFPKTLVVLRNTILVDEPAGWPALLEDSKQQHMHNQLLLRAWQE